MPIGGKVVKEKKVLDEELQVRIKAEQAKFPGLPPKYVGFTIKFKCFWIWVNIFGILSSAAMAAGSILILGREHEEVSMSYQEC